MIGIVLWSNEADQKAVVWCDDHGDLAYLDTSGPASKAPLKLEAGDMVEFKLVVDGNLRRGRNARLIQQSVCHDLQDRLRAESKPKQAKPVAAENGAIIAFPQQAANDAPSRHIRNA